MTRAFRIVFAMMALTTAAAPALAQQTYRLEDADGTVHLTNTPTDPKYRRMGLTPTGTSAGYLRLPAASDPAAKYAREIRDAAFRYGVPEQVVAAIIRVESGFNPNAVSRKGAQGLMQLMPGTASTLGVRDAFNPMQNIEGGVRHLRGLIERFQQSLPLALAAYNAGEQAVALYRGIPPFPETQEYVARIMRLVEHVPGGVLPAETYRTVDADGTTVYTNIPPRRRPRP